MMGMLDGESAIITGGAQGIGKAIALKFAKEGANVLIMDIDLENHSVQQVEKTLKQNLWGRMPMPSF